MKLKSFDGLALSQYEIDDDIPLEFGSGLVQLPQLAGAFDAEGAEQRRQPLVISRKLEIVESSFAAVDTTLDSLRARANLGQRWLVVEMRDGSERGTWAKLKALKAAYKPEYLMYLPVQLTFEVAWPWFELAADILYLDAGWDLDDGVSLDPHYTSQAGDGTFTINNTGGDRITRGLLVMQGASSQPRIENVTTGEWVQYGSELSSGETLVIDIGTQTAMLSGLNVWPDVAIGDMQTRLFSLNVGSNLIMFSGGGTLDVHWARVY